MACSVRLPVSGFSDFFGLFVTRMVYLKTNKNLCFSINECWFYIWVSQSVCLERLAIFIFILDSLSNFNFDLRGQTNAIYCISRNGSLIYVKASYSHTHFWKFFMFLALQKNLTYQTGTNPWPRSAIITEKLDFF